MILLSADTCINALNMAALNRKTAFRIELAVGLGVFLAHGGASRDARRLLNFAYAGAGYECTTVTGLDYKTVNRRINATADLYDRLHGAVAKWGSKHTEGQLLSALCIGLEPYEFFTVKDVQRYCQPERVLPPRRNPVLVAPHPEALDVTGNNSGQGVITEMFRRASDQVGEGARRVEVGHLALIIPAEAGREELIAMARRLLEMADQTDKKLLTA